MTANRTRLGLESLETREVLSTYTVNASTGELSFTGTSGNDYVEIRQTGAGGAGSVQYRFSSVAAWGTIQESISTIYVNTSGGQDTVSYTQNGDLQSGLVRSLRVQLGDQDDVFSATVNGNVTGAFASMLQGLYVNCWGQGGNDRMTVTVNGDVTGYGVASFRLFGGTGVDFLTVDATNDVDITKDARFSASLEDPADSAEHCNFQFHYRGELDGYLGGTLVGGNSYDWLVADMTFDSGSSGRVSSAGHFPSTVFGHGAADDIEVRLKGHTAGLSFVRIDVYGGGGNDRYVTSNGAALMDWAPGESIRYI